MKEFNYKVKDWSNSLYLNSNKHGINSNYQLRLFSNHSWKNKLKQVICKKGRYNLGVCGTEYWFEKVDKCDWSTALTTHREDA